MTLRTEITVGEIACIAQETKGMGPRQKAEYAFIRGLRARFDGSAVRVPSLSHPGEEHEITRTAEGYACPCEAYRHCWHLDAVDIMLALHDGSGESPLHFYRWEHGSLVLRQQALFDELPARKPYPPAPKIDVRTGAVVR